MNREKTKTILVGLIIVGLSVFITVYALTSNGPFSKANKTWLAAAVSEQEPLSVFARQNVAVASSALDTDNDGLTNEEEINAYGTDPWSADSDADRLIDSLEISRYQSDPNNSDSDGDGYSDAEEIMNGYSPTDAGIEAKLDPSLELPGDKISEYLRMIDEKLASGEELTAEDFDFQKQIGEIELSEDSIRGAAAIEGIESDEVRGFDEEEIGFDDIVVLQGDSRELQLGYAEKIVQIFSRPEFDPNTTLSGAKSVEEVLQEGDVDEVTNQSQKYANLAEEIAAIAVPANDDFVQFHLTLLRQTYAISNVLGGFSSLNGGGGGFSFILDAYQTYHGVNNLADQLVALKGKYDLPLDVSFAQTLLQSSANSNSSE